jgi:hypothetical protein
MPRFGNGAIALVTANLIAFAACSSEEPAAGGSSSGGEAARGGEAGRGGSGGDAGSPSSCIGESLPAKQVPLDIFAMLDASDSMSTVTGSRITKWSAVTEALGSFSRDPVSAGIGLGVGYFPIALDDVPDTCTDDDACGGGGPCIQKICLNVVVELGIMRACTVDSDCVMGTQAVPTCMTIGDCSTNPGAICFIESTALCDGDCIASGICSRSVSCDAGDYEAPAEPISELPEAGPALTASLQQQLAAGTTPTVPALSGAVAHARAWAESHPDRDVITLLVMGGLPNECFDDPLTTKGEALEQLLGAASDGEREGMRTFVIGLFSAAEIAAGARADLDSVAEAGGTEQSFTIDTAGNVTSDLASALDQIRGAKWGCEFQVPEAAADDYDKLNLDFSFVSATRRVPRVESESACDPTSGGWHYDVEPGADEPTRVVVCPASCETVKGNPTATVQFELGCDSQRL